MSKTFNFDVWNEPLKHADFKYFYDSQGTSFWLRYGFIFFTAVIFVPAVLIFAEIFLIPRFLPDAPELLHLWIVAVLICVIPPTIFGLRIMRRDVRLAKFCRDNDLVYHNKVQNLRIVGAPFLNNHTSQIAPLISGQFATESDDKIEKFTIGRYMVVNENRNDVEIRRPFTFAQASLPKAVPHIILKNRGSRIIPLIGAGHNNATLRLEGDYSDKFEIICPKNYERDVLYIFTPEVIAAVYDFATDAELELVDDQLLLYTHDAKAFRNPTKMAELFDLLARLDSRFDQRAAKYHDSSAAAGTNVAKSAQRLNLWGWSPLTIMWSLVIIAIIAINLLQAFNIGPFRGWFMWISEQSQRFLN